MFQLIEFDKSQTIFKFRYEISLIYSQWNSLVIGTIKESKYLAEFYVMIKTSNVTAVMKIY